MARQGKIARLPVALREELNQRLLNGEPASVILPWLNALPETQAMLAQFENVPVNDANLSAWRLGGYAEWEERQNGIGLTKDLAAQAMKLSEADGGNITAGALTIVAGHYMQLLEAAASGDDTKKLTPEETHEIVASLAAIRAGEIGKLRAKQDAEKLRQKDEELKLAREKFQRDTAEMVLKSARDAAVQEIANAPLDHSAQLSAIGKHIFGDLWK